MIATFGGSSAATSKYRFWCVTISPSNLPATLRRTGYSQSQEFYESKPRLACILSFSEPRASAAGIVP